MPGWVPARLVLNDINDSGQTGIWPFRIDIPQANLEDLHTRLARTRWPDQLPGAGWDHGIPVKYVPELARYRRLPLTGAPRSAGLNEFPGFGTIIDGQNAHFLHARSPEPGALPLVITHGWPGSIVEFVNIIGPLTDPAAHGGDPRRRVSPRGLLDSRLRGSPDRPGTPAGTSGASRGRGMS